THHSKTHSFHTWLRLTSASSTCVAITTATAGAASQRDSSSSSRRSAAATQHPPRQEDAICRDAARTLRRGYVVPRPSQPGDRTRPWRRAYRCGRVGGDQRRRVMGLLRRRGDSGGTKYRMREKLFAVGDDYWIEDEQGDRVFKVDGKALRLRDTLQL